MILNSVSKDISSAQCKEVTGSRDVLWINEDIGQWTLPWRISEIFLQYCISLTAYCYKKGEARKDIQLTPKKLHFQDPSSPTNNIAQVSQRIAIKRGRQGKIFSSHKKASFSGSVQSHQYQSISAAGNGHLIDGGEKVAVHMLRPYKVEKAYVNFQFLYFFAFRFDHPNVIGAQRLVQQNQFQVDLFDQQLSNFTKGHVNTITSL